MARVETFKVSPSGQMMLPAAVRHRWHLDEGGRVDVLDLGFGLLTVPAGYTGRLLDEVLPAADRSSGGRGGFVHSGPEVVDD
jgi:AbrB family looped-hinge helix DNA binding protein